MTSANWKRCHGPSTDTTLALGGWKIEELSDHHQTWQEPKETLGKEHESVSSDVTKLEVTSRRQTSADTYLGPNNSPGRTPRTPPSH